MLIFYLMLSLNSTAETYTNRFWTDAKGRILNATFVGMEANIVSLKREDGRVIQLPIAYLSTEDRTFLQTMSSRPTGPAAHSEQPKPIEAAPPTPQMGAVNIQTEFYSVSKRDSKELATILAKGKENVLSPAWEDATQAALKRFAAIPMKKSIGRFDVATMSGNGTGPQEKTFGGLIASINCTPTIGPDGLICNLVLVIELRDHKRNIVGQSTSPRILMSGPGKKYIVVPDIQETNGISCKDAYIVLVSYSRSPRIDNLQ